MKSNEEFIAGIYEKASRYVEVEQKQQTEPKEHMEPKKHMESKEHMEPKGRKLFFYGNYVVRLAAMLVLCAGITWVGVIAFFGNKHDDTATGEKGIDIVRMSETEGQSPVKVQRFLSDDETDNIIGIVADIDTEKKLIIVKLQTDDKTPAVSTTGISQYSYNDDGKIVICLTDLADIISNISIGTKIKVEGNDEDLAQGINKKSITLTDLSSLWIWKDDIGNYINYRNIAD